MLPRIPWFRARSRDRVLLSRLAAVTALCGAAAAWAQSDPQVPATDEPGVIWAPASPTNFRTANRPADRTIDRIVIHDIEGPAESAVRWFQNPRARASAHYVVGADARVWQQVRERDIGWHAGNSDLNARSIGLEHEGYAYRPGFFCPELYEASARLVRSISERHGIPRDRTHIIAHAEVPHPTDPNRRGGRSGHTDPGPYWDWDYYMTLVRSDARVESVAAPAQIRPGERLSVTISFTNRGDDPWPVPGSRRGPADAAKLPVLLGVGTYPGVGPRYTSALHDTPTWISPQFLCAPAGPGEIRPANTAAFTFTLRGPRTLGVLEEKLRLARIPIAPRIPVAFGPTTTLRLAVRPWEIDVLAGSPDFTAPGWTSVETLEVSGVRKWFAPDTSEPQHPARWKATLPLDGEWEIYTNAPTVKRGAQQVVYNITSGGTHYQRILTPGKTGTWQSLGRYRFSGSRPEVQVSLTAVAGARGYVSAGGLRFVGPFSP